MQTGKHTVYTSLAILCQLVAPPRSWSAQHFVMIPAVFAWTGMTQAVGTLRNSRYLMVGGMLLRNLRLTMALPFSQGYRLGCDQDLCNYCLVHAQNVVFGNWSSLIYNSKYMLRTSACRRGGLDHAHRFPSFKNDRWVSHFF